ncbi:nitrite reductase/sulfite reductase, partial [mine drainage metagenome]
MIDPKIDNKLKGFMATLPSEEIFFEAIRELMKDVIKEFLKKRINSDPELKD